MAGIGFELKKMLGRGRLGTDLAAVLYAGMISAGPLILSILAILLIGIAGLSRVHAPQSIVQFQVSVTYLISFSLVVTGGVQLVFSRYVSDRVFDGKTAAILPNYQGMVLLASLISGALGLVLAFTLFDDQTLAYRLLMMAAFVLSCNVWVSVSFLASVKRYPVILMAFFLGYGVTVGIALELANHGVEGLLAGFVVGQAVLLALMMAVLTRHYHRSDASAIAFDVLAARRQYASLAIAGLCFNLGVWADKFIFWFSATGQQVIGPLRASVIYDLPIFISYLCIIPGMAVFLLRLETGFADSYQAYYAAVREGGTLDQITAMRDAMVQGARTSLYEILKIQTVVTLLIFAFGDALLEWIGISVLYFPLLKVDVVSAGLQLMFLACLNIFLYLDRRRTVAVLAVLFVLLNAGLTWLTLELGPDSYGYGFAIALLIVTFMAVCLLNRSFSRLEYQTYMLQRG